MPTGAAAPVRPTPERHKRSPSPPPSSQEYRLTLAALPGRCGSGKVLYDTGAGVNVHPDIAAFDRKTLRRPTTPTHITTAGGARKLVQRIGDAYVVLKHRGVDTLLVLHNAIHEPDCPHVLVSGCLSADAGFVHDSVRQTLVGPGDFGDVSRLAYSRERVLEFMTLLPRRSSLRCVSYGPGGASSRRPMAPSRGARRQRRTRPSRSVVALRRRCCA